MTSSTTFGNESGRSIKVLVGILEGKKAEVLWKCAVTGRYNARNTAQRKT